MDGDDGIEVHKIVLNEDCAAPADYIDGMIALGWLPCLVVGPGGEVAVFERYPRAADPAALVAGYKLSAWWMASPERQDAVAEAMRRRGLVHYL